MCVREEHDTDFYVLDQVLAAAAAAAAGRRIDHEPSMRRRAAAVAVAGSLPEGGIGHCASVGDRLGRWAVSNGRTAILHNASPDHAGRHQLVRLVHSRRRDLLRFVLVCSFVFRVRSVTDVPESTALCGRFLYGTCSALLCSALLGLCSASATLPAADQPLS